MSDEYTYDCYEFFIDGSGYSAGLGATSEQYQLDMFERFKRWNPENIHMVLRRPDNSVLAFYHPSLERRS